MKFAKLDTDAEERIAAQLQIKSLPTLLAIHKGRLLEAPLVGLPSPQVLRCLVRGRVGCSFLPLTDCHPNRR